MPRDGLIAAAQDMLDRCDATDTQLDLLAGQAASHRAALITLRAEVEALILDLQAMDP